MSTAAPHIYVECDLPDGMTLADWRRSRHATRARRGLFRSVLGLPAQR